MTPDEEEGAPLASIGALEGNLVAGRRYSVKASFADADGDQHDYGESWVYRGCWFSRYDDLVTLFVTDKDGYKLKIPLLWRANAQEHVLNALAQFFVENDVQPSTPPDVPAAASRRQGRG